MAESVAIASESADAPRGGFEVAATVGQVPNNRFTQMFVGAVHVAHSLGPHLGVASAFTYTADFGARDLKALTKTYVYIGYGSSAPFVQNFDKLAGSASLALTETAHGSFSWFGSRPIPLSVTGLVGVGALAKRRDAACAPQGMSDPLCPGDAASVVVVVRGDTELRGAIVVGGRADLHVADALALRLDVRDLAYVDSALDGTAERHLFHDVLATIGLAWSPGRHATNPA